MNATTVHIEMIFGISIEFLWYSPKNAITTSSSINCSLLNWDNLSFNKEIECVGDIKGTDLQYLFVGKGFDSTYDSAQKTDKFSSRAAIIFWKCYLQQSYKTMTSYYALDSLFEKYTSINCVSWNTFLRKTWTLNFYISLRNDNDGIHTT